MATGANATPLGKLHPSIGAKRGFDSGPGAGLMAPPGPAVSFPLQNLQQPQLSNPGFSQFPGAVSSALSNPVGVGLPSPAEIGDFGQKKRKRSRWSSETPDQKTIIPGMPTVIPPGLTRDQERAYIGLHLLSPSTTVRGRGLTHVNIGHARNWRKRDILLLQRWWD
uniref:Splicing factor 1-like n=1 Tax=Sinocyclocheilus grahami TaxID=75366 RepID=A0A672RG79_SINGR